VITIAMCVLLASPQGDAEQGIEARVAAMTGRVEAANLRRSVESLVSFGSRHVLSAGEDAGRGTGAARSYLEDQLRAMVSRSGGRLSVSRQAHAVSARRLGQEIEVVNVVATLRGVSDPDRIYVVGGHYDSINGDNRDATDPAPGANDDASGTAAVLEACRVMCEVPFAATILFVCYDGEEMGLLGSTAHAAALRAAEAEIDGMITNDIVGNTLGMDGVRRRGYLRCFSYAPRGNDSSGRSLARAASFAISRHLDDLELRLVYRGDRFGRGGDHRPFMSQGYPAVRFTEPREDYSRQHQDVTVRDGAPYGDLPGFMDFDYLAKVCRANVATLAELASAPAAPTVVRARGARDAYDTRLSWRSVDGAVSYEAVWRLTVEPDWTGARPLAGQPSGSGGSSLSAVLEGVCLDDSVVGIRSVGADGSRSRVTTPPEPDAFGQRPSRRR